MELTETDLGMMRLENTTPPHNKFYEIRFQIGGNVEFAREYVVTTAWGRIRGHARQRGVRFLRKGSAVTFIKKAIAKRVAHGYHAVGVPSLRLNETHE